MAASSNKQRVLSQLFTALPAKDVPAGANGKPESRPVLEQFLYAVCREGTTREKADKAFRALREGFFDWNEVRVSSVREIADALGELPGPEARAQRIIGFLQEVFETTFSFDLEGLHKKGLKLAAKQLARYEAASDYAVAFVTQQSLGGHALPLDAPSLRVLQRLALVDDLADRDSLRASLEHLVPKAKGPQFSDLVSGIADEVCWKEAPQCGRCLMAPACAYAQEARAPAAAVEMAGRAK